MTEKELIDKLNELRSLSAENEVVEFKEANIETFLRDKLPDILTETQKKNKVTNLLSSLRIGGKIQNSGYSEWSIV
jgi:ATP-dependent DNA helicase RecG